MILTLIYIRTPTCDAPACNSLVFFVSTEEGNAKQCCDMPLLGLNGSSKLCELAEDNYTYEEFVDGFARHIDHLVELLEVTSFQCQFKLDDVNIPSVTN